jgi:hypothetical protein
VEDESEGATLSVSVDGVLLPLERRAFPLEISLAVENFMLLQPPGFSHFDLLRNKLRWV